MWSACSQDLGVVDSEGTRSFKKVGSAVVFFLELKIFELMQKSTISPFLFSATRKGHTTHPEGLSGRTGGGWAGPGSAVGEAGPTRLTPQRRFWEQKPQVSQCGENCVESL